MNRVGKIQLPQLGKSRLSLTRLNVKRLDALGFAPVQKLLGDELRPVVHTQRSWKPAQFGQVSEHAHNALCRQARIDLDRQALPYTLIEHVQHAKAPPVP